MYTDKILVCADCGQQFVFTASEQDFYAQRGFTDPKRCSSCRSARKASRPEGGMSHSGGFGGGYERGPRQMFPATCSKCGRSTEVPFRPTNGKPVYCSDCFRAARGN
ncbi:MAG: zinc-ribbon domain containing protein [Candidatus Limnocylindrales bacterium]